VKQVAGHRAHPQRSGACSDPPRPRTDRDDSCQPVPSAVSKSAKVWTRFRRPGPRAVIPSTTALRRCRARATAILGLAPRAECAWFPDGDTLILSPWLEPRDWLPIEARGGGFW